MAEQSFKVDGGIEATGIVTASTFKKPGGTSTQFLKADGSVDSRSFSTSDTTYDITANDTGVANRKYIRLTNSGAGTTDVVLKGGSNVTINRTNNELEIASSYTDTDTTYALSAINDGSNKSIVLTAGGSGSGISSISLLPGSNVSLTRSNNDITINSTTYNIQDGQFSQNNFTNALKTKLDGINNDPTYNSLVVTGVTTFNQDVNFPGALYNIHWDQPTSKFKFDDNAQCVFGSASGGDLRIFHAGGHSTIKNETGQFRLAGNDIRLQNQNNSEDYILCTDGADVKLFFNDNEKVATTNWGTKITGVATITQGVNVGGALTVTGNTTIGGNLTVNGTQTIINSNTLEIGDSQIVLNRDETGAPSQNAGIIVERGTSTNVSLRWAEGTDTWEYTNDGSTYKTIGSSSISAADGDLTSEEKIRLTDPNGGTDDVVLAAGNGLSIARSGDKITFTNSATDSDTTYSQSFVDSSNDCILRLSAGGSGSGDDDLKFVAGSNITLTPSGDNLTIAVNGVLTSYTEVSTLDHVCDRGSTTDQNITTSGTLNDGAGNVRELVNNSKTAAYTLTANDVGELINTNSNVTVPSGVFSAGQAITIYNNSGSNITIARSSVTMYTAGTSTNTDKTLAEKGICTVVCVSSNTFVASGAGMS